MFLTGVKVPTLVQPQTGRSPALSLSPPKNRAFFYVEIEETQSKRTSRREREKARFKKQTDARWNRSLLFVPSPASLSSGERFLVVDFVRSGLRLPLIASIFRQRRLPSFEERAVLSPPHTNTSNLRILNCKSGNGSLTLSLSRPCVAAG